MIFLYIKGTFIFFFCCFLGVYDIVKQKYNKIKMFRQVIITRNSDFTSYNT